MREIDAGAQLEQLGGEVPLGADAGARIIQHARTRLGLGDEFGERAREIGLRQHQVRRRREQRNRHEILVRVVRHALVDQRIDDQHARGEEERVAIGPRPRRSAHRDISASAAAILDHDALADLLRKRIGHDAGQDVDRPGRRERNDDADRTSRGIRRLRRRERCGRDSERGCDTLQEMSAPGVHCHPRWPRRRRRSLSPLGLSPQDALRF